jgi:hypothetical protein
MLDAVVEGSTLMMSLYDYLVGPILIQGFVDMLQIPFSQCERYFAVLRPWSVSFYAKPDDFMDKPLRIIPTCMMDTLPKMRLRGKDVEGRSSFDGPVDDCYDTTKDDDDKGKLDDRIKSSAIVRFSRIKNISDDLSDCLISCRS